MYSSGKVITKIFNEWWSSWLWHNYVRNEWVFYVSFFFFLHWYCCGAVGKKLEIEFVQIDFKTYHVSRRSWSVEKHFPFNSMDADTITCNLIPKCYAINWKSYDTQTMLSNVWWLKKGFKMRSTCTVSYSQNDTVSGCLFDVHTHHHIITHRESQCVDSLGCGFQCFFFFKIFKS